MADSSLKDSPPKNYALVIGNGNYNNKKEFPIIPYCINDANEIFRVLTNEEYSIFCPEGSVLKTDVRYQDINKIIEKFLSPIASKDLVLFYFAGHGKVNKRKTYHLAMKNTLFRKKSLVGSSFNIENLLPFSPKTNILGMGNEKVF